MSLSARLRSLFEAAGARFVELPVLHPADPFLETAGEDVRRRMFVTDGPQGERLALRPDFTIPVCLAHLKSGVGPARYAYEGLVFRRHDTGSPERLETGYEDIGGESRVRADAEALALAIACAGEAGPGRPAVRLGDIALFVALLRALGLPGRWRRKLRQSFGVPALMQAGLARMALPRDAEEGRFDAELRAATRNEETLVALLTARREAHHHAAAAGRTPAEIAGRFLDQRAIPDAATAVRAADIVRAYLALRTDLGDAAERLGAFASEQALDFGDTLDFFAERAAEIGARVPDANIRFEAGFGRPLDYYTGLVFEIRAGGREEPLIGGGRYDRMMEMLGADRAVPAVGFTMRLDQASAGAAA